MLLSIKCSSKADLLTRHVSALSLTTILEKNEGSAAARPVMPRDAAATASVRTGELRAPGTMHRAV